MIFNVGGSNGPVADFSYSGAWTGLKTDRNGHFEAAFFTSGTLTIRSLKKPVDVFLVGGGANGAAAGTAMNHGGRGGSGGRCYNARSQRLTPGTGVSITVGGAGSNSTLGTLSSASGTAASGGAGGICVGYKENYSDGGKGADGVYPFGASGSLPLLTGASYNGKTYNLSASRFGAAGGGGGGKNNVFVVFNPGAGGTTGGGRGASEAGAGVSGSFFGAGGGGGGPNGSAGTLWPAGSGFQGIVIIRDAR